MNPLSWEDRRDTCQPEAYGLALSLADERLLEGEMITDDVLRQHVYGSILKAANKRVEQAIAGSSEGAFAHLSLAALLNLLFLVGGEWGSMGDYITTQRAPRATVGDALLWHAPIFMGNWSSSAMTL